MSLNGPFEIGSTHFDVNEVIAKIFVEYTDRTGSLFKGSMVHTSKSIANLFQSSFSEYMKVTYEKCSKVKTILHRDHPISIGEIYTNIKLENSNKSYTDNEVIGNIEDQKHIVISGLAGTGKTMFMKYLSLARFESPKGRIPLFIELRLINSLETKKLLPFIHYNTTYGSSKIAFDDFMKGLSAGSFTFILDGYDELDHHIRDEIEQQILEIALKYPGNQIVVSGRPDSRFESWEMFYVYKVRKMKKDQILSLIKKLNFDSSVKKQFLTDVDKGLYKKHESFLCNHLLATMMLLTYQQFARVPTKIHNFYDQAFVTLFLKHDALKSQYRRKTYTKLEIDSFRRCFAAFCRFTYVQSMFSFTHEKIIEQIGRAIDPEQPTKDDSKVNYPAIDKRKLIPTLRKLMMNEDNRFTELISTIELGKEKRKAGGKKRRRVNLRVDKKDEDNQPYQIEINSEDAIWIGEIGLGKYLTKMFDVCSSIHKTVRKRVQKRDRLVDDLI